MKTIYVYTLSMHWVVSILRVTNGLSFLQLYM